MQLKIIYLGSPEFAVKPLEGLLEKGFEVSCVVTQPDKAAGRGLKIQKPPVKIIAEKHDLKVFQPESLKTRETRNYLKQFTADFFIVAAYGKILPPLFLQIPKYGCINIHASLLPKFRGAAPINWAIINGEKETGITIMKMDAGLDTGDSIIQKAVPISLEDTSETLTGKLSGLGAEMLLLFLEEFSKNRLAYTKQEESKASYAPILRKEDGLIDWQQSAEKIHNLIRGLKNWPSAYSFFQGKLLKFHSALFTNEKWILEKKEPGTVEKSGKRFFIHTGEGFLEPFQVQPEGKNIMDINSFYNGNRNFEGARLG